MDTDEILTQFAIRTPCPMDWDRMIGNDRVHFCERCRKHVYNLTTMSPDETAALISTIRERNERRCVRLYQRPDGTLTTSGCEPALQDASTPQEPAIRAAASVTPDIIWIRDAATPRQFTIRFLMAIIAGFAALLGLTRWLSEEESQPSLGRPPTNPRRPPVCR